MGFYKTYEVKIRFSLEITDKHQASLRDAYDEFLRVLQKHEKALKAGEFRLINPRIHGVEEKENSR